MSEYLTQFIEFFGLDAFFGESVLTVQECIGYSWVAFLGGIFLLFGARCVFELIKTVTDWRNFK